MSNRSFCRMQALQKEVKYIEGHVTIGAAGAVGSDLLGLGVTSITHSATGAYTVALEDPYNRIMGLNVWFSGTTFSGVFAWQLDDATPNVEIKTGTGGTFKIQCYDANGADVLPAENSILNFEIMLRNSSVGQSGE